MTTPPPQDSENAPPPPPPTLPPPPDDLPPSRPDTPAATELDPMRLIFGMSLPMLQILSPNGDEPGGSSGSRRTKRRRDPEYTHITREYSQEEYEYFSELPADKKRQIAEYEERLATESNGASGGLRPPPLRFRVLSSDLEPRSKSMVLAKLAQYQGMAPTGEYYKLRTWINAFQRIPIGIYAKPDLIAGTAADAADAGRTAADAGRTAADAGRTAAALRRVRRRLDRAVFGHDAAKDQMVRILAQWCSCATAKGRCIGIEGPPGVGKTVLVKEGISRALGLPFGFIALGGATDSSFLEGHSYTYEGSTHGKIVEVLMKAGAMNPILFFDELDKVSDTHRGDEIIGVLTHLTDISQNDRFCDRYFPEVELNLSRCLFVFTYNDISRVNPILLDRMIKIKVGGYSTEDKIKIAQSYLIPELLKEYGFAAGDIEFDDAVIAEMVGLLPKEEGVRNLRRGIDSVIANLGVHRYLPPAGRQPPTFPYRVSGADLLRSGRGLLDIPPPTAAELSRETLNGMYV